MARNSRLVSSTLFHAFPFYPCCPCFSGALIFWKNKKGFVWVIFTEVTTIISCMSQHVAFQKELNIHQIFHLLNKKIKKNSRDLSFNRMNYFEKLYPKI